MSNHSHRLPEPSMPENELIRAADTLPELSSGLRSSTMVLCQSQFARAQRLRRIKAATATVLVASLAFAVFALVMSPPELDSQPIAVDSEPVAPPVSSTPLSVSPGESPGTSSGLTVGLSGNKDELKRIDGKIEELQQRMLKAKMLPNLGF